MDQALVQFVITAFVMLIVVINPVAVAPVFTAVTSGLAQHARRSVLSTEGMSGPAVGGIPLFIIAMRELRGTDKNVCLYMSSSN